MAVALVTGATRGIGRAIAAKLAEEGHRVAVGYGSDAEAAERLAGELGGAAGGGDLAPGETAGAMVDAVEAAPGPVEILVANAGINTPPRRVEDIAVEEWDRVHAVNLRASFLLAQRVLPGMTERGFGRIVFISSVAAYTGGIVGAHYASSKAGLHALAHSLSKQSAAQGVTVNVVAPALVESDMLPDDPQVREQLAALIPDGPPPRPEEVADLVAAVVRNAYLTNQSIPVDGGLHPT